MILYLNNINGDEKMKKIFQKLGESDRIIIPSSILKSLDLKTNDIFNLEQIENKISLAEKFEEYNGKNLAKEFSWNEAIGKEIW